MASDFLAVRSVGWTVETSGKIVKLKLQICAREPGYALYTMGVSGSLTTRR